MFDETQAEDAETAGLPMSPGMKAKIVLQEVLSALDAQMPDDDEKETLLKRMVAIIDDAAFE